MYSYQKDFYFELKNDKLGERGALNSPGMLLSTQGRVLWEESNNKEQVNLLLTFLTYH